MLVENTLEDVLTDVFAGVVVMLLSREIFWTVDVATGCTSLLVKETERVAGNAVEVEVVVGIGVMFAFIEEIRLTGVVVGDVGTLFEKVGKGVPTENVDESVDMLWTADVVLCGTCIIVDNTVVGAVSKVCVVILPQFSSQQNALIS